MGSAREENTIARYMPPEFKKACPCCGKPWSLESIEIQTAAGMRTRIRCANNCFPFCETQHFVPSQMDIAWKKLWRSFVRAFGLPKAIMRARKLETIYLAVDKDGSEACIFDKPMRGAQFWYGNRIDPLKLKPGSIAAYLGRELTWSDDPVAIDIATVTAESRSETITE